MTDRKMVSRAPRLAGNVMSSFAVISNKKSILAHGLNLRGRMVRSRASPGSQEIAACTTGPVAYGCFMESAPCCP